MDYKLEFTIDEEFIKQEVDKSVRKRIKEMQGGYTSKEFIEQIINKVVYEKVMKEIPNIDKYIQNKIDDVFKEYRECLEPMKKSEILNLVIDKLLNRVEYLEEFYKWSE